MKAVVYNKYGISNVLELKEIPKPEPNTNEVLIKVYSASINPVDWKLRRGDFRFITGRHFPIIPGQDCSGIVEKVGSIVKNFKIGDEVIASTRLKQGCYSEYVAVKEKYVYKKWEAISFEEAASIPIAGITALQALVEKANIRKNMNVLINGASGGVGTFALQIAKVFDTNVTAVTSYRNIEFVKRLGADYAIDYTTTDFTQLGQKYDIIFDTVSTRKYKECINSLTKNGVFVNTLLTPEIALYSLVTFFYSGKKCKSILVRPKQQHFDWFEKYIKNEQIRIIIDKTYPLEKAKEATNYSESGRVVGKICLKMI